MRGEKNLKGECNSLPTCKYPGRALPDRDTLSRGERPAVRGERNLKGECNSLFTYFSTYIVTALMVMWKAMGTQMLPLRS